MSLLNSCLKLRSPHSAASGISGARKSKTSLLGAMALCAAVLAGSAPVYPSSAKAGSPAQNGGGKMAPTETVEQAAALHHTLQIGRIMPEGQAQVQPEFYYEYWTLHPFSKKLLVFEYAYDTANCAWITAGTWYNSSPIYPKSGWHNALNYGSPSQKTVLVEATSGRCAGFRYDAAAAYYEWEFSTGSPHNAALGGTWKGAGLKDQWDFLLYLK
jgi:hypothetical protein